MYFRLWNGLLEKWHVSWGEGGGPLIRFVAQEFGRMAAPQEETKYILSSIWSTHNQNYLSSLVNIDSAKQSKFKTQYISSIWSTYNQTYISYLVNIVSAKQSKLKIPTGIYHWLATLTTISVPLYPRFEISHKNRQISPLCISESDITGKYFKEKGGR